MCGGFNKNGFHRLKDFIAWSLFRTVRRCGLSGVGAVFSEEKGRLVAGEMWL